MAYIIQSFQKFCSSALCLMFESSLLMKKAICKYILRAVDVNILNQRTSQSLIMNPGFTSSIFKLQIS